MMRTLMRGGLTAVALCAAGAAPAAAHVIVRPSSSRPADLQRYEVIVPNERDADTVGVRVQVPEGVDFALVEQTPGWKASIVRRNGKITELRWSGGRIGEGEYRSFALIARTPVTQGDVKWPALQRYADGHTVRWIGPPDSDEPAPVVRVGEDVTPRDTLGVTGEKTSEDSTPAAATPSQTKAAVAIPADDDSDWLPIAGLVVGALGVLLGGLALTRRRRAT